MSTTVKLREDSLYLIGVKPEFAKQTVRENAFLKKNWSYDPSFKLVYIWEIKSEVYYVLFTDNYLGAPTAALVDKDTLLKLDLKYCKVKFDAKEGKHNLNETNRRFNPEAYGWRGIAFLAEWQDDIEAGKYQETLRAVKKEIFKIENQASTLEGLEREKESLEKLLKITNPQGK